MSLGGRDGTCQEQAVMAECRRDLATGDVDKGDDHVECS